MKRTVIGILVIAVALMALAGCGRTEKNEVVDPTPPMDNGVVVPEDDNGVVEDDNGIIGDANDKGDKPAEGILPEIGSDIENGANEVIDGVGDAVTGNDNNAGSDVTRGRVRPR